MTQIEEQSALSAQPMPPETYPTGMLKNSRTGRFHPISFRRAPLPHEPITGGYCRYKSAGHHTDGFETLSEAMQFIIDRPAMRWIGASWMWDGVEIPAMINTFTDVVTATQLEN